MKISQKACQNIAKSLIVKPDSPYLAAGMGREDAKLLQLSLAIIKAVSEAISEAEEAKIKAASKTKQDAQSLRFLIEDLRQ